MITVQLEMTDGTYISADISYGKMTDTVTVDTTIGTFVFQAHSIRRLIAGMIPELGNAHADIEEKKSGG